MDLFRTTEMNEWTSLEYHYKQKNNEGSTEIRAIFLAILNDTNSKVFFLNFFNKFTNFIRLTTNLIWVVFLAMMLYLKRKSNILI